MSRFAVPNFVIVLTVFAIVQSSDAQQLQPKPSPDAQGPMATPRPKPDERLHVQLKDGSLLVGKLAKDQEFHLDCVLGKVAVPTTKLMSVHFLDDGKTKVLFRNGDSLTGVLESEQIELKASWGEIAIDTGKIHSIMSHDQVARPGAIVYRTFQKTPDGEVVQWQFHSNVLSYNPKPASAYGNSAPGGGAPGGAAYSPMATPSYPGTVPGEYRSVPTPATPLR